MNLVGKQKGKQSNGFIKPEEPLIVPPGEASGFYVDPALPVKVLDRSAIAVSRSATAITLIAGFQAGWFGPLLPSIALAHHLRLEQTGIMVSAVCAGGLTALASSRFVIARLDDLKVTLLATILLFTGFAGLGNFARSLSPHCQRLLLWPGSRLKQYCIAPYFSPVIIRIK